MNQFQEVTTTVTTHFMGYIALDEKDAERKATKLNELLHSADYANGYFMKAEPTNYINNHGVTVSTNLDYTETQLKDKVYAALSFDF